MIVTSLVIPTYKRKTSVLRLLSSLKTEWDREVEIILVEQRVSHRKEIKTFCASIQLPIIYFFLKTLSMTHARNIGVKKARGKYILFLDDDVVVSKGLIRFHILNFSNPSIAAVCGRVITPGQMKEEHNTHVGKISLFGKVSTGFSSTIRQEVDTVIGCNMCWRKDALEKLGLFDEQFTGNALREESDISLRSKKAGYKVIFEPKAVVTHLREPTGGARKTEGRLQWYFHFFSNETYFFLKHRSFLLLPVFLCLHVEWAFRCMFGFGREVNWQSISFPFLGIINGIQKYRKYANRR